MTGDEAKIFLHDVEDYTYALDLLNNYDNQKVIVADTTERKEKRNHIRWRIPERNFQIDET